jgi:hypothetical protein
MLIQYESRRFSGKSRRIINCASEIIEEYQAEGFDLTLRQLFYQFVARGFIPNTPKEYNNLGVLVNNARLAGLIDWESIVDRTRTVNHNNHFKGPGDILAVAAKSYKLDTRATQGAYLEVWIEKDALLGVIEPVCRELDVTYLACKGYYSQSEMWRAAERIGNCAGHSKDAIVFHLGDHDPSGLDMTRDIRDRLGLFGARVNVIRLALDWDQVEEYDPPPNPTKLSDTRAGGYIAQHGNESWELDALDPRVIRQLIEDAVAEYTDKEKRQALIRQEAEQKKRLTHISDNWEVI